LIMTQIEKMVIVTRSTIDVNAEYLGQHLTFPVSKSDDLSTQQKYQDLFAALRFAAKNEPSIVFQMAELSSKPETGMSEDSKNPISGPEYFLFALLRSDQGPNDGIAAIQSFISKVNRPAGTEVTLGETFLAISSPENYRDQLLSALNNSVRQTKAVLGGDYKAKIQGLENPILVRKKNQSTVTVFLDYKITFH